MEKKEVEFKKRLIQHLKQEKNNDTRSVGRIGNLLGAHWNREDILKLLQNVPEIALKRRYDQITAIYRARYQNATMRTAVEHRIGQYLRTRTQRMVFKSFWIGPFNVDFFVPTVIGHAGSKPRMKGLVVEVDGPVHNLEDKMLKDEARGEFLKRLEIAQVSIPNDRASERRMDELLEELRLNPMTDTRTKNRLLRVIYIATIISFSDGLESIQNLGETKNVRN